MISPLPAKEPVGFRSVAHVASAWACLCCDGHEDKRKVRRRARRVAQQRVKQETTEAR